MAVLPHPNNKKSGSEQHQPIFNMPTVVVVLAASFIIIHAIQVWLLDIQYLALVRAIFAFNPKFYTMLVSAVPSDPIITLYLWSPITHAFLHADWTHAFVNIGFMVAFASPVAKRIGALRFLLMFAICATGGAALHWFSNPESVIHLIGASGAVSGFMGAASRFAFQPRVFNAQDINSGAIGLNIYGPALTLLECITDKKFLNFFAIWMVTNFVFGNFLSSIFGGDASIAWQAHIGGFLTGIVAMSFLDRENSSLSGPENI